LNKVKLDRLFQIPELWRVFLPLFALKFLFLFIWLYSKIPLPEYPARKDVKEILKFFRKINILYQVWIRRSMNEIPLFESYILLIFNIHFSIHLILLEMKGPYRCWGEQKFYIQTISPQNTAIIIEFLLPS